LGKGAAEVAGNSGRKAGGPGINRQKRRSLAPIRAGSASLARFPMSRRQARLSVARLRGREVKPCMLFCLEMGILSASGMAAAGCRSDVLQS
jgi:hypothetical protein